jgi:hypothetical protein
MTATRILTTLSLVILLSATVASAQQVSYLDAATSIDTARNTVFVELSTALLTSSLSLNYEYQFHPNISARLGAGASHQFEGANAAGGTVGVQFNTSGEYRLEGGVGLSLLESQSSAHLPAEMVFAPALNLGYRYQPTEGGMMFRVGLSYSYNYGFPFEGSAGYSF